MTIHDLSRPFHVRLVAKGATGGVVTTDRGQHARLRDALRDALEAAGPGATWEQQTGYSGAYRGANGLAVVLHVAW